MGEGWRQDYGEVQELDYYEGKHLATEEVDETYLQNLTARKLADEEIEAREERMRQSRVQGDRDEYRLEVSISLRFKILGGITL